MKKMKILKAIACATAVLTVCGTLAFSLTGCGAREADFPYERLAAAVAAVTDAPSCHLKTETAASVHYQPTSLKKYDVEATQCADVSYLFDAAGNLTTLQGNYTVTAGKDTDAYSVYYTGGRAYFDEDGRLYSEEIPASAFEGQAIILFFGRDEIVDYRAEEDGDGGVRVFFTVPWESASDEANRLYNSISDILKASGMNYQNVTYDDIKAEFVTDGDGALVSYSYAYTAHMTVDSNAVTVRGTSGGQVVSVSGVTLTPPDFSLYDVVPESGT